MFEAEIGHKTMTTFNCKIKEKELQDGLKEAINIDAKDYDYEEWFFCKNNRRPYWFAYNLGIYVIDKYCKKYEVKPS